MAEKKRRLERNKIFARKNRLKKKEYIADLEQQIRELKVELEIAQKKLLKY